MTFGEKLKKARVEAGYTQEELANILLVSRAAIAKWESDRGMPEVSSLKSVAEILQVSVDYLLDTETKLDLSWTKKSIDLRKYGDDGKLSRIKKITIKEKIIREEFPEAEIKRLTITKIRNTKPEGIFDAVVGWFSLLLGGIPLFGTVEMGKLANSLDQQCYLVNDQKKQYFVVMSDEFFTSRLMANPITSKKFDISDKQLEVVGKVD